MGDAEMKTTALLIAHKWAPTFPILSYVRDRRPRLAS